MSRLSWEKDGDDIFVELQSCCSNAYRGFRSQPDIIISYNYN